MAGFGWHNPWPFQWGGGTTEIERLYIALREAVGKGGSAEDPDSIEQLWRQCKAIGLGSATAAGERAALNAFPWWATDHLEYYEGILHIVPLPEDDLFTRNERVSLEWTRQLSGDLPSILERLQDVAPGVSFYDPGHELSTTTEHGRAFESMDGLFPFGGSRSGTAYPNVSTEFRLYVLYPTTEVGPAIATIFTELGRILDDMLPAWNDYSIVTSLGFFLDISPLDLTAFDP